MSLYLTTSLMIAGILSNSWPVNCKRYPEQLERMKRIEFVESRGNPFVIGTSGERGSMQVIPRYSKFSPSQLSIKYVGRLEGCRIYNRWMRRAIKLCKVKKCKADDRATMAYNAGNKGLYNKSSSGQQYLARVKR